MKKKNVHLTSRQVERIEELARGHNLGFAEMLRRVLDSSPMMKPVDPPGLDPRMGMGRSKRSKR